MNFRPVKKTECSKQEFEQCEKCKKKLCTTCELEKLRYKQNLKKLPNFIYDNLKKHGNCSLDERHLKALGEKELLKDLKKNGFDCKIVKDNLYNEDCYAVWVKQV